MNVQRVKKQLSVLALSMFRKDFFGIYHGSISAKIEPGLFVINTRDTVFDSFDEQSMIELYYKKDYRWKDASIDADIHQHIYKQLTEAKFITFSMPPFTTAYSLQTNVIIPKDYFGYRELGKIEIHDPKNFEGWYERAATEIPFYFLSNKTDIMVIRGYGVYSYNRDLLQMAKRLAILEKSCRLLMLNSSVSKLDLDF
jgi:L-fuculose-phosphate aldolase